MVTTFSRYVLGGAFALCAAGAYAALPTGFHTKVIFDKADMVSTCVLPDGRVLVVEKYGKVSLVNQKTGAKTVAIDLSSKTWSSYEAGMMCIVADPDFTKNGYVYIQYCKKGAVNGEDHNWVDRFKMNGDVIDGASAFKILDEGYRGPNYHHGGGMAVNPKDGMLYINVGSRRNESTNENQPEMAGNTKVVLGKICRVKIPSGEIPSDNPWYAANSGDAKANWAYGVRNPFTISVHPTTGKIWFTDVQDANGSDEINEAVAGQGYGYGGGSKGALFNASGASCAGGAMVGSLWYTGNNFPASYKDKYFFGQVRGCSSNLKYTDASHSGYTAFGPFNTGNGNYSPIDVKMDAAGAIYVSTRYQTENVRATAGQVIKVWYGDTEPEINPPTAEHALRTAAENRMVWSRLASGGLSVRTTRDGLQTVSVQTLDGKVLAERSIDGKGSLEFPLLARGLHVLAWKAGEVRAAAKVML